MAIRFAAFTAPVTERMPRADRRSRKRAVDEGDAPDTIAAPPADEPTDKVATVDTQKGSARAARGKAEQNPWMAAPKGQWKMRGLLNGGGGEGRCAASG